MKYYFRCPNCGNDERFVKPQEKTDLGCALFFLGGLIPALLYANHTRRRVQCASCGLIFSQPPLPSSPLAKFAGEIVFLVLVLIIVAGAFFLFPDLADSLPAVPGVATVEQAVAAHPRVAAYVLVFAGVSVLLFCWLSASLSNFRFRRQLSAELRLKLPTGHEPAPQDRPAAAEAPVENRNA